ncbi:MAG: putative alpha/beta-fold hydrolase [Alphaproteobacteria bacterium]|jgi:predicted alpha/beta-fold hydrolase
MAKTKFGSITVAGFEPKPWLKNTHLQTILPKFLLSAPEVQFVNERIITPDHDFVDLAWAMPDKNTDLKGIVILFHGLEGSSQSHYIKHLVSALTDVGLGSVVMHFRGCSGEPNLTSIAYHSGATYDAEFIVPIVKARYKDVPLFAVGYSLGGNMLMKLMAHHTNLPIEASVCVSAPLNLAASSSAIQIGFSRTYQWHLMKSMKGNLLHKMQMVDMSTSLKVSATDIANMTTFVQFDEHVTSVLHGFDDASDYYQKCSALHDLALIEKPTLILHAKDDPFMDEQVVPDLSLINENIAYELSAYGGHVGFLKSLSGKNKLWLPQRITNFLSEFL